MLAPDFIVSSISQAKRKNRTPYTDTVDPRPVWRVTMKSGWCPQQFMQMWFSNQADANRIPRGDLSLSQLFTILSTGGQYQVTAITPAKASFQLNNYLPSPAVVNAWIVSLEGQAAAQGRWLDMWFANQAEANLWAIGRAYHPFDVLRMFRVLIVAFPANGNYVPEDVVSGGFWTSSGFHGPGIYPGSAFESGGYSVVGTVIINLAPATNLGFDAILLSQTATYFVIEIPATGQVETIYF